MADPAPRRPLRILRVERLGEPIAATPGGFATLGVFDGVHRGHCHLLQRLVARARAADCTALVLTFAIHPVVVVKGLPPRQITSLPHRLRLFEAAGVDECVVLPFDASVRALTAEQFAETVFVRALALRGLVLGQDARIGRDRGGDAEFLAEFARRHGIAFEVVGDLVVDGERVSSTKIRAAIGDGDLERARRMLGRDVSILGTVVRGDGRGRKLGFATANLDLHHEIRPPAGVYAVRARIGEQLIPGVMNIGIRPTFGPDGDLTVEVHLIDFAGDLYGQDIEVVLDRQLRGEKRFGSGEELVAQIEADVAEAKALARRGAIGGSTPA